jgi:transglutaminase-like putative cysteine protease
VLFENRSLDNVLGHLYGPGDGKNFDGVIGKDLSNPIPAWAEHGADRKVVPYTVATDMDSPNPDSGEEYFHTNTQLYGVLDDHNRFKIGEAVTAPWNAPPPETTPPWEAVRDRLRADRSATTLDAYQFVFESPHVAFDDAVLDFVTPAFTADRPILDAVRELTGRIHREFRYDQTATTVATPVAEVLRTRRGVCQDFAHLEIACLRALGLAARYVSGYILTVPPPGTPRLVGADASHAWLAVWVGDAGWVDVDPTNDQLPSDQHITAAWGRDYADVSPLRGVVLGGGAHRVSVAVDVTPLD